MMPDAVVDRERLPVGFGTLPLTRLVLAPYAFDSDARGLDPFAELRGLQDLQELVLEKCQVKMTSCSPLADTACSEHRCTP